MVVSGSSSVSGLHRETTVLSLVMAYRSFGRFRRASTRLDTPPCSGRHHPVSAIALRPDITLPGTTGRLLSVIVMLAGVTLFLRLAQAMLRPSKIRFECPNCG